MVCAVAPSSTLNPPPSWSPHHIPQLESSLKVESVGLTNELCPWPTGLVVELGTHWLDFSCLLSHTQQGGWAEEFT